MNGQKRDKSAGEKGGNCSIKKPDEIIPSGLFYILIILYYLTNCNSLIRRGHFPHLSIMYKT